MNVSQAIELASSLFIPEFLLADGISAVEAEREKTEEAIRILREEWFSVQEGSESFSFDLVRDLADRNRTLCDLICTSDNPDARALSSRIQRSSGQNLSRWLSDKDLIRGIAAMQQRPASKIVREIAGSLDNLAASYMAAPITGNVLGIDLETTSRNPDRGYIINVGWEMMELTSDGNPTDAKAVWCGLPPAWDGRPVPLEKIHHITTKMLAGKMPFRRDKKLQKHLIELMSSYPYMAHNASFEDSWLTLNLDGYAEGRKAGTIIPIDTRDICRRLDKEAAGLPRESHPASLENWARRRGTLNDNEAEQHLGLDDTDLMLRTVQAEFTLRNMFGKSDSKIEEVSSDASAFLLPNHQTAINQVAAGLIPALNDAAAKGNLSTWAYEWISTAIRQLRSELADKVHLTNNKNGFVATISTNSGSKEAQILQAQSDPTNSDQKELATAMATFAALLAQTAAQGSLPACPVTLDCNFSS